MNNKWISCEHLNRQELETIIKTESFWGKGRYGWCDFAIDGIDLLLQGIHHLRNVDNDALDKQGEYKDFTSAIRSIGYYRFYQISLTYKAIYNLIHQGYYTESAILLRSIFEDIARMKYLCKKREVSLLETAFAGHYGYKGKKFRIQYETMFENIAPGSYKYYRMLCDMAHGSFSAHSLKIDRIDHVNKKVFLNDGIVFNPEKVSFVLNQFCVFLLAHIVFMIRIYPEIEKNMPEECATRYHKILSKLWAVMKAFSETEQNQKWYSVMKKLVTC